MNCSALTIFDLAVVTCSFIYSFLLSNAVVAFIRTGEKRIGPKSKVFFLISGLIGLTVGCADSKAPEATYEKVAKVNQALMATDSKYRLAKVAFREDFDAYSDSLQVMEPTFDERGELLAIGRVAGETRRLGEKLQQRYGSLRTLSKKYQSDLNEAKEAYGIATSNAKSWATAEDVLDDSSRVLRKMAEDEEFKEISNSYQDLALLFEALRERTGRRFKEVEVSREALDEAMEYITACNRYLFTVEQHAKAFAEFDGPDEILDDIDVYQQGVGRVQDAIRDLTRRLKAVNVEALQAVL